MAKFLTLSQYNDEDKKYFLNVDHILSFNEGHASSVYNTVITMVGGEQHFVAEPIIRIIRMINIANNEDTDE